MPNKPLCRKPQVLTGAVCRRPTANLTEGQIGCKIAQAQTLLLVSHDRTLLIPFAPHCAGQGWRPYPLHRQLHRLWWRWKHSSASKHCHRIRKDAQLQRALQIKNKGRQDRSHPRMELGGAPGQGQKGSQAKEVGAGGQSASSPAGAAKTGRAEKGAAFFTHRFFPYRPAGQPPCHHRPQRQFFLWGQGGAPQRLLCGGARSPGRPHRKKRSGKTTLLRLIYEGYPEFPALPN